MRRLIASALLIPVLVLPAVASWDYSAQKFGAGVGVSGLTARYGGEWFPDFPNFGVPVEQYWGKRFGLTGVRLLERFEFVQPDVSTHGTHIGAECAARFPFAPSSSFGTALSVGADFQPGSWDLCPSVGIVLNQNDQDFLVGSRELWYRRLGLLADVSMPVGPDMPRGWGLEAMVSVPYTVRSDWGRIEAGPRLLARTGCPVPLYFEAALEIEADGGRDLTPISRFAEEHESPGLGWKALLVPSYRTWRLSPWEGDTAEIWFNEFLLRAYGAVRLPVVRGLHVEPALTIEGSFTGGLWYYCAPSLGLGCVQPLAAEKHLVVLLETRASSWRVWENHQLSLAVSYGCRDVTRVGDNEPMQGPGGTMDPWKDRNQNPSP